MTTSFPTMAQMKESGSSLPAWLTVNLNSNHLLRYTQHFVLQVTSWKQTFSILVSDTFQWWLSICNDNYFSDSEGGNPLIVVAISLVAVFLVFSIIIFIVGFFCGQRFNRKSKGHPTQASSTHPPKGSQPVPVYETIELEENMAYAPSTSIVS